MVDPLLKIEGEIIEPMNSYFLCNSDFSESEKVMNMVRLLLSNDGTLEEVAESMAKTRKAATQAAGGQREELVNT